MFALHNFDCCIHFAGLKAVGESVEKPWEYYENNINGTLVLLEVMRKHGCKNIVFSSSATVYGNPAEMPITEACPKGHCTNPYGKTKSMLEEILTNMHTTDVKIEKLTVDTFGGALHAKCAIAVTPEKLIVASPNADNRKELAL